MEDEAREGLNRAEQLAARARELAARAEQISQQAADAGQSEEQLAQLERELAQLDEEERSLDAEFDTVFGDDRARTQADDAPRGRAEDRLSGWADRLTERMESFGDRFSEAMSAAFAATALRQARTRSSATSPSTARCPVSVDNFAGKIDVKAGEDRPRARRSRNGTGGRTADRDSITVDIERDDDGVHIRCSSTFPQRPPMGRTSPSPSPRRRRCVITTMGGSIQVDGVGGPVIGETQGGAITSTARWATRRSRRMGGSIAVTEHEGPVTAHTKGGSIRLEGALTGRSTRTPWAARYGSTGSTARVRARTVGGSVHVSGRLRGVCSL